MEDSTTIRRNFATNFLKGLVPLAIATFLVWWAGRVPRGETLGAFVLLLSAAAIVWFGWSAIRANIITKWIGILFVIYFTFIAVLIGFILGLALALPLLLIGMIATPWIVYDFFFRAPKQGRFARARDARGRVMSQ
jgi:hypothetical protein